MSETNYEAPKDEWEVGPMPEGFPPDLKREKRGDVTWVVWPGTKEILPLEFPLNEGMDSHPEEEAHLRRCAWNCVEWFRMGRLDMLKGQLRADEAARPDEEPTKPSTGD
jgi:hypothetical protein